MKRVVALAAVCGVLVAAATPAQAEDLVAKGKSLTMRHRCQLCHIVDGKGGKITKIGIDAMAPYQSGFPFQRVRFKDVDLARYEILG